MVFSTFGDELGRWPWYGPRADYIALLGPQSDQSSKIRTGIRIRSVIGQSFLSPFPGPAKHPRTADVHQLSEISSLFQRKRLCAVHTVRCYCSYLPPSHIHLCSYPHALHHLDLLQHAQFRSEMKKDEFFREHLHQKQFDHWRTW